MALTRINSLTQVSSDTINFVFKSTAIDTNNDPIGTYNTYTVGTNTNTATLATTAPTQSSLSMNTNGFQVFAKAWNAASTAASPAKVDIFIGKGLKSKQVDMYLSAGKSTPASYDYTVQSTNEFGVFITYSEITGILQIDAASKIGSTNSAAFVNPQGAAASGYFVFNASKPA